MNVYLVKNRSGGRSYVVAENINAATQAYVEHWEVDLAFVRAAELIGKEVILAGTKENSE